MVEVAFGLGANLGDRKAALEAGIAALAREVAVTAVSSLYETAPFGHREQPEFLNCCVAGDTRYSARRILELIATIESSLGRRPRERWGPREIDIDLLLYGDDVVDEPDLVVPHPGMADRAFVLVPLVEIAPLRAIPGLGITVNDALARLERTAGDVRRVEGAIAWPGRRAP